jgi:1-acyl-sn-glycerol-3-phosphate acyltransferase
VTISNPTPESAALSPSDAAPAAVAESSTPQHPPVAPLPPSHSVLLAWMRLQFFAAMTSMGVVLYQCEKLWNRSPAARDALAVKWINLWSRWMASILGIKLKVSGPTPPRGAIILPNHLGYADVFIISAAVQTYFAPKAEVLDWPVAGFLIKLMRIPTVLRRRGSKQLAQATNRVGELLAAGHHVCLFLEGTSTGGDRVLPYRPAFLQAALDSGAPLVPAGIRWRSSRPDVSISDHVAYWHPDHHFARQAWTLFGISGVSAEVVFGEPIPASKDSDRKKLAVECRQATLRLLGLEDDQPASMGSAAAAEADGSEKA